jgi:hypothetical protein
MLASELKQQACECRWIGFLMDEYLLNGDGGQLNDN